MLARRGNREVWWIGAGSYYSDLVHGHSYAETRLVLADVTPNRIVGSDLKVTEVCTGGRLTQALLKRYAEVIDTHMRRPGLVDLMDLNMTTVVGR